MTTRDNFNSRYTGHCPTLRFHYGKGYGTETKHILQELRDKEVYKQVAREHYTPDEYSREILRPIAKSKGQTKDFALDNSKRPSKYILGYTGFIPTLNFRYGKSFSRTADDSVADFTKKQRHVQAGIEETDRMLRTRSAPKLTPLRGRDQVSQFIRDYEERTRYKEKHISPDFPPIAGYTGHIPRVKCSEESLSQRYHTVVKRGLTLLQQEREKRLALKKAQSKITDILKNSEEKYGLKDI